MSLQKKKNNQHFTVTSCVYCAPSECTDSLLQQREKHKRAASFVADVGTQGGGVHVQPCRVAYNLACAVDTAKTTEQPRVGSEGL